MKKFCEDLKKQATKIINCEKKDIMPLTKKEDKRENKQNFVIYVKKDLMLMVTIKNIIR